eukprot:366019-Chlamydomonas_euryale.AAC.5
MNNNSHFAMANAYVCHNLLGLLKSQWSKCPARPACSRHVAYARTHMPIPTHITTIQQPYNHHNHHLCTVALCAGRISATRTTAAVIMTTITATASMWRCAQAARRL